MFKALLLTEKDGKVSSQITQLDEERLPDGDVTVRVQYSTLNYKDGLILNGLGRLVRTYPHVPGVDFAGVVEASRHPAFRPNDTVILTGWRVGEAQWGGYAERARVKGDWLVKLPADLTARNAMAIGTAGFTSMLCVMALEGHALTPAAGDVLVTGAAGGVGSVAVAILAKLGYRVVASTGRADTHEYLKGLGAAEIIDRAMIGKPSGKPLESERWAGCIDSVGGATLSTVLAQMKYRASVAACGLAGGNKLETTVIPFIIRGVKLLGIDSVMSPPEERRQAWERLARDLPSDKLEAMIVPAKLEDLPALSKQILDGKVRGRVVVEIGSIGSVDRTLRAVLEDDQQRPAQQCESQRLAGNARRRPVLFCGHHRAQSHHDAKIGRSDNEHQQHERPTAADAEQTVGEADRERLLAIIPATPALYHETERRPATVEALVFEGAELVEAGESEDHGTQHPAIEEQPVDAVHKSQ
jgi:acrylyl-CoA reductase (NADPH)